MIEGYLLDREQLAMVMVLVDGEIGPTKLDVQMLDWLRANDAAAHRRGDQARQGQVVEARQAQASSSPQAACSNPATSSG